MGRLEKIAAQISAQESNVENVVVGFDGSLWKFDCNGYMFSSLDEAKFKQELAQGFMSLQKASKIMESLRNEYLKSVGLLASEDEKMDKKFIASELVEVAKLLSAGGKVAMPVDVGDQVGELLDTAKRSMEMLDKIARSLIPMCRGLRRSEVNGPADGAVDAVLEAKRALGGLVGACSSALVEHETAFMASEKE